MGLRLYDPHLGPVSAQRPALLFVPDLNRVPVGIGHGHVGLAGDDLPALQDPSAGPPNRLDRGLDIPRVREAEAKVRDPAHLSRPDAAASNAITSRHPGVWT